MLELDDIQGLVFSGYARQPHATFWFLTLPDAGATEWLARVLPRITSSEPGERSAARRLNLALTPSGLTALGLPAAALATFPETFLRGMAAPERSALFGDEGQDGPETWQFGGPRGARLDALLLSYAAASDALDEEAEALEDGFERFGIRAHFEDVYLAPDRREHFGFADARTNPRIAGGPRQKRNNPFDPDVPAGEFLLGHRNAYGHLAESPRAPVRPSSGTRVLPPLVDAQRAVDFGLNGTFLVVQKLAQDVDAFRRFTRDKGAELWPEAGGDSAARLAAALVGRTFDGRPLVGERPPWMRIRPRAFAASAGNRFGYREEGALSTACPLGAHIRRANPRDGLGDDPRESLDTVRKHRLIRRSRLYGAKLDPGAENDGVARGLLFVALCADLGRQFELVRETWLGGQKFGGLTRERDPFVGFRRRGDGPATFSLQGEPYRRSVALERFVRMQGGGYFFMPGLRALAYLAEG